MLNEVFKKAEKSGILSLKSFVFVSENGRLALKNSKFSLLKEIGETIEMQEMNNFIDTCINANIIVLNEVYKYIN